MSQPETKLSDDLLPIYRLELELGNQVAGVAENAWTACPLAVSFGRPLHLTAIRERLVLPATVEFWENRDSHYPIEAGYRSTVSRHSIAGPLEG